MMSKLNDKHEIINKLLLDSTFRNWVLKSNIKDADYWTEIFNQDEGLFSIAKEAKAIILDLETSEIETSAAQSEQALNELQSRLLKMEDWKGSKSAVQSKVRKLPNTRILDVISKIAAAVTLLVVGAWLAYYFTSKASESLKTTTSYIERRTTSGQQLTLKLSDGTNIKLNNNSSIKFPENFVDNRSVILNGEAFFDVARNETLPFKVHSGNLMVEVLGTSFNVKALEQEFVVTVESGEVRVLDTLQRLGTPEYLLHGDQAVAYNLASNQFQSVDFNADDLLWKDGVLVFKDQDIRQISAKLERWFNVDISLENENAMHKHFTAKYPKESLEEILLGMSTVLNFDFEIDNNKVLIKGKTETNYEKN